MTALVAILVEPLIPVDIPGKVGADAVANILDILASSMLAVTTFSFSVMVASFSAATQNVTPRATRLLMQDNTSQNVLSTFVGSFLFSLVGIISLGMGAYGGAGRVVLFAVTLGVIVLIIIAILRWVGHLTLFGRVGDTTKRVETATSEALTVWANNPSLGAQRLGKLPAKAQDVTADRVGYVQYVDLPALQKAAESCGAKIYVLATPGRFVDLNAELVKVSSMPTGDEERDSFLDTVRSAISIDDERSFDQDPRFGLVVLSEIASRALSPAVNDMGTAIDVIGRQVRLLSDYAVACKAADETEAQFDRVHVPQLNLDDLFEDAFAPVSRDGAGLIEVQIRLQKAFAALSQFGGEFKAASQARAEYARALALSRLPSESDRDRIKAFES